MESLLIKNVALLSMSSLREKLEYNMDVEITNGIISNIGKNINSDLPLLDGTGKVLMPGFMNMHTHIPMCVFKDTSSGLKLGDWLNNITFPNEKKLTREDIYFLSLLGGLECLESGITTVNDHYYYADSTIKALNNLGLSVISTSVLMDNDDAGVIRLNDLKELMYKYKEKCLKLTVGIHSLYTCSEAYIKELGDFARNNKMIVHMHFCETSDEVKAIKEKYHVEHPTEVLEKYFDGVSLILAHAVKLDEYDYGALKKLNATIVHCPVSNMMLGCGVCNVPKMLDLGINVTLGTDGPGSGNNNNFFETMRLAGLLQKGVNENPLVIDDYEILKMATINGAKGISMDHLLGSIDTGKYGNMVMLNLNEVNTMPMNNVISDIIYNATTVNVDKVIVAGEIIIDKYNPHPKKNDIMKKSEEISKKIFS